MKLKKLLSIIMIGTLVVSVFCYPLSAIAKEDYSYKLDKALAEKLEKMNDDDIIPVSVWLKDINHESVKTQALQQIKGKVSDDVYKIAQATGNELELLKLNEKEISKSIAQQKRDSLEIQKYIIAERSISSEKQKRNNISVFNSLFEKVPEISFNSQYTPNVETALSKKDINTIIESNNVTDIFYPEQSTEFTIDDEESEPQNRDYNTDYFTVTNLTVTRDAFGLNGNGVNVGVYDAGFDTANSPNYFANNNVSYYINSSDSNTQNSDYQKHGSAVSCIIGGRELDSLGNNKYLGAVPSAQIYATAGYSYKISYEYLINQGCNVINMSKSALTNPLDNYNTYGEAAMWLDHISTYHNVHVVMSSGNTTYYVTEGKMSYNSIVVGGCNNSGELFNHSSFVDDDELQYKPDLVAPGVNIQTPVMTKSGTSFSAPMVTSAVAQLCQLSTILKTNPRLMKSVILSGSTITSYMSSEPMISVQNGTDIALSRSYGAGMLNAANSYVAFHDKSYYINDTLSSASIYGTVHNKVIKGLNKKVRFTLCWYKKVTVSGTNNTNNHLGSTTELSLDELKLKVTTPSGKIYYSAYSYDNKQMITINPGENGTYQIQVIRMFQNYQTNVDYSICASAQS